MNHLHPDIPDMEDAVLSIAFSDPPNLKWELSLKELVLQSQHVPGENSGSGTTAVYESIPGIRLIYRKSKVPTEIHCSFKLQADRPFQIQSAQLIIPLKDGTPNHVLQWLAKLDGKSGIQNRRTNPSSPMASFWIVCPLR